MEQVEGAAACGEPASEQPPVTTCGPMERGAHRGPVLEELQPREGPVLERFVQDCLQWEGPHAGAGKRARRRERQRWSITN